MVIGPCAQAARRNAVQVNDAIRTSARSIAFIVIGAAYTADAHGVAFSIRVRSRRAQSMTTIADRFEIESVAGTGAMGTVYRARDLESPARTTVALKVVRGAFANARFEREAMLLEQIEGEGIVRYVAHGRIDAESMYLAMEWLEGEGLDARLARGPLAIGECIALGRRLARALGIAHARGVVHRDVKPSNVILRGGLAAEATLVDFGIARAPGALRAMTATGAVIGTPQYMAPEQARGESLDGRADVFSLGCLLFECLSGRAAFVGAHVGVDRRGSAAG
jgi:serine/threonine protein kinase